MTKRELREKVKVSEARAAEIRAKAGDLDNLLAKLQPVLSLIERLLPEEVKNILKKYGYLEE